MLDLKNDEDIYSFGENITSAILNGISGLSALAMLVLGIIECAINRSVTGIITVAMWLFGVFLFLITALYIFLANYLTKKEAYYFSGWLELFWSYLFFFYCVYCF